MEPSLHKLDLNLWVLPSLFGRSAMFCDVGIALRAPAYEKPEVLGIELVVPFLCEPEDLVDVVPIIREDQKLANLVFGNNAQGPRAQDGTYVYHDGDVELNLTSINISTSHCRPVDDSRMAVWSISTNRSIRSGELIYLRVRFRIRTAGRIWTWQSASRRHSHAISDVRVNELRERPAKLTGIDFGNDMLDPDAVNCFVIAPGSLKAGRVSPEPKYVRVLEGAAWERYMDRSIPQDDRLVVTYWRRPMVNEESPFRAFLELERRRPTALRSGLIAALSAVVVIALLSPPIDFERSVLGELASTTRALIAALTVAALATAWRFLVPFIADGRWKKIQQTYRRLESRWYKLKK